MARKRKKSSKAANQARRMVQIVNGSRDRKPDSPVFVLKNKKIRKFTAAEWARLEEEAESLSYLAGTPVFAEYLIK